MVNSTSPFSQVGPLYMECGYSVIPIIPEEKTPGSYGNEQWQPMKGWVQYAKRFPTLWEVQYWSRAPMAGVGIPLGHLNRIVALDFDNNVDDLHETILEFLEDSPVKKVGAKGFTAFYQYSEENSFKKSINNESVIELLSHGRQTVLPPSIHPSLGGPYRWSTELSLLDIRPEQLPRLPKDFHTRMDRLFGKLSTPTNMNDRTYREPMYNSYGVSQIGRIRQALVFVDPDDYHTWVEIGMALKTELGEAGFELWDFWSASSHKYKKKELPIKWRSFNRDEIKIGTLFYYAKQSGYVI